MFIPGIMASKKTGGGGGGAFGFTEAFDSWAGTDGTATTWVTKDLGTLSGVPANAVVYIMVTNKSTTTIRTGGIRAKGSALSRTTRIDYSKTTNDEVGCGFFVKADTNSDVEFYVSAASVDLTFRVMGWFGTASDFSERWGSYTPATADVWNDTVITGAAANDIVHLMGQCDRPSGSSHDGWAGIGEAGVSDITQWLDGSPIIGNGTTHMQRSVNLNASKEASLYKWTTGLDYIDQGTLSGMTFTMASPTLHGTYHAVTTISTWEDWTLDAAVPIGSVVEITMRRSATLTRVGGVRDVGSTLDRKFETKAHLLGLVGFVYTQFLATVDANRKIQVWAESININQHTFSIKGWYEAV